MIRLALLGALLLACIGAGAATNAANEIGALPYAPKLFYVTATIAAGLTYLAAVAVVRQQPVRRALPLLLLVAGLARVITFATPPLLSTDLFRYVWDGRVQAAGINPYLYLPAAPELAALRDQGEGWGAIYPHINRADTARTIYPPAAQALFALLGQAWPSIWGVKAAMLAFDLVAMGAAFLLLRTARSPPELLLIYAWNPLPLWEFGGAGHIDAAAVAFTGLALVFAAWQRRGWAGAALGLAILSKLLPLALVPAIWRRWDWRAPLAAAMVIAAGYAVYARAGWRVLGYLPGYADEEGVAGHGAFLVRLLAQLGPVPRWIEVGYLVLALAGLGLLAAVIAFRAASADPVASARCICRDALWLGAATAFALSPHYAWYFAGLALPAVLAPSFAVLWLTVAAPLLYLDDWHDQIIWPSLVFLPFVALLARELWRMGPHPALAAKGG